VGTNEIFGAGIFTIISLIILLSVNARFTILVFLPLIAQAALDRDVAAMPEGLNTFIGFKGMRLSGGQLHRTAAARMLLRQPERLVFDDLSSALDLETEQKLWSCLFEIKRLSPLMRSPAHPSLHSYNPTCLAVSHRPFLLRQADRIIVLKDSRVEAEGKLENLNLI
jgi:ATP-binding cassette subfamily B protein/ATP-binding cassette subfamily C protein